MFPVVETTCGRTVFNRANLRVVTAVKGIKVVGPGCGNGPKYSRGFGGEVKPCSRCFASGRRLILGLAGTLYEFSTPTTCSLNLQSPSRSLRFLLFHVHPSRLSLATYESCYFFAFSPSHNKPHVRPIHSGLLRRPRAKDIKQPQIVIEQDIRCCICEQVVGHIIDDFRREKPLPLAVKTLPPSRWASLR